MHWLGRGLVPAGWGQKGRGLPELTPPPTRPSLPLSSVERGEKLGQLTVKQLNVMEMEKFVETLRSVSLLCYRREN